MKKIKLLDIITILVLVAIIASLIYAFLELYNYHNSTTVTPTETTTTTEAPTETATKKANWGDEFEKSFRHSNAQYEEVASDVNQNITIIEPIEHPTF